MEGHEVTHSEAAIPLAPILEFSDARSRQDDWSGTSDPVLRRKLQNRLNQRASRRRRGLYTSESKECNREKRELDSREGWLEEVSKHLNAVGQSLAQNWHTQPVLEEVYQGSYYFARPGEIRKIEVRYCMHPKARAGILSAPDYMSWLGSSSTNHGILLSNVVPMFSADHLLTLTHFNTIRAMLSLVALLGVDHDMLKEDILSPFFVPETATKAIEDLPPTLRPTEVQKSFPHHPELDVIPFPRVRDNLIRAVGTYSDHEMCMDIIGLTPSSDSIDGVLGSKHKSTGLLVWGDPTVQGSWEVSETFATKWKWVLEGCEEALVSTNYWRAQRDEPPLRLEELS